MSDTLQLHIQAMVVGSQGAVGYLVWAREGGSALVVDAPLGSAGAYLHALEAHRLRLDGVVTTHGHWDVIADNAPLCKATGAPLCAHSWDAARLANPSIGVENVLERVPDVPASRPDRYLHDHEVLDIDGITFEVMHSPGHTPGSVCLYSEPAGALFSGDLLRRHGVGRTDFPGGNPDRLRESLLRLAELPDETRVYPSHGLPTTIKNERWLLELARA